MITKVLDQLLSLLFAFKWIKLSCDMFLDIVVEHYRFTELYVDSTVVNSKKFCCFDDSE
jgi:hypothetical protein